MRRITALAIAGGLLVAAAGAAVAGLSQNASAGRESPGPIGEVALEQTLYPRFFTPEFPMTFSPDGKLLAVPGHGGTSIYNLATDVRAETLPARHAALITSLAFSPHGSTLAVTTDGTVATQLWNTASWRQEPGVPQPPNTEFDSAAFGGDGRILIAASQNAVYLWNLAHRKLITRILSVHLGVDTLAVSPDGATLALGGEVGGRKPTGNVYLQDLATRRRIRTIHDQAEAATGEISTVAYGRTDRVLVGADGQKIYLWSTVTGRQLRSITAPGQVRLRSVAFSPDGQTVAATGTGDAAYVWDARTGKLLAVLPDPDGNNGADTLAYSPDSRTLAVSEFNGKIDLWNISALRRPARR